MVELEKICTNAYVKFLANKGSNVKLGLMTLITFMTRTVAPVSRAAVVTIVAIVLATTVGGGASSTAFLPEITSQPKPFPRLPYFFIIPRPVSIKMSKKPIPKTSIPIRYNKAPIVPQALAANLGKGYKKVQPLAYSNENTPTVTITALITNKIRFVFKIPFVKGT